LNLKRDTSLQPIHRAVWAPGLRRKEEALRYSDTLLLSEIKHTRRGAILDLGCGVGSSMQYLAGKLDRQVYGITLSSVQSSIGNVLIEERGLGERVRIIQGDFSGPGAFETIPSCGAAYAVESLVHCADTAGVLRALQPKLEDNARLLVIDDFLHRQPGEDSREQGLLRDFKENWYAYGLKSVDEFIALAGGFGFSLTEKRDLTAWTLQKDIAKLSAAVAATALRHLPKKGSYIQNIVGGGALQKLTKRNIIGYYLLAFRYR
jgi:cyclopropane fatty-acyl-phospholipid synthase-like methyltransferase